MNDLKCVECEQTDGPMIVFVGTLMFEDGTIENLQEGMHPYCTPCREKLNITDELNAGRDLRAEARQMTLDAVEEAKNAEMHEGLSIIMAAIDDWIGSTDKIFGMLGRRTPERPQEVFDGVSDAMGEIDPSTMDASQALALITVTNTISDRIENWKGFVDRTYEHFKTIMSEKEARGNLVGFL